MSDWIFVLPLVVYILEDDDMSRLAMSGLLLRDERTTVRYVTSSARALLRTLHECPLRPNVILIDTHHRDVMSIAELIGRIKTDYPDITIVCVCEYADSKPDVLRAEVAAGADGYLDKDDVKYAYATAVLQAHHCGFVYSPSVESPLLEHFAQYVQPKYRIEAWRLHPHVPAHLVHVVYQCILHRMKNRQAAYEFLKENGKPKYKLDTVNQYLKKAYDILLDVEGFYDRRYLPDSFFSRFIKVNAHGEAKITQDGAFHIMTATPVRDHPVYQQVRLPDGHWMYDEDMFSAETSD